MELPPIIYEDDCLIAFDKPTGMLTAPDRLDKDRKNVVRMVQHVISKEYFNAHRLDRETSGVLLFAKNKDLVKTVCAAVEAGSVKQEYVAIVHDVPRETSGTIDVPIAGDLERPGYMRTALAGEGRDCTTTYAVTQAWRRFSLLGVSPAGGRTHQIRVHLAFIGCPVVCDAMYGSGAPLMLSEIKPDYKPNKHREELPLIDRLALHSHKITVPHPVTGATIMIESPLPKPMQVAIKQLSRWG